MKETREIELLRYDVHGSGFAVHKNEIGRYLIYGIKGDENILVFDLSETECLLLVSILNWGTFQHLEPFNFKPRENKILFDFPSQYGELGFRLSYNSKGVISEETDQYLLYILDGDREEYKLGLRQNECMLLAALITFSIHKEKIEIFCEV